MTAVRVASLALAVCTVWVLWERRLTLRSRFDAPNTIAAALFGAGVVLTSPWPSISAVRMPFTGEYYVLMLVGEFCFLVGAALGIKSVYLRLLPDDAVGAFMRARIVPLIAGSAVVLVVSFSASSTTSTNSADHLYLSSPDSWLAAHWIVYFGTIAALGTIMSRGVAALRSDPRSVMLEPLRVAVVIASLSALGGAYILVGREHGSMLIAAWLLTYAAFFAAAVASVVQWRNRVRTLISRRL